MDNSDRAVDVDGLAKIDFERGCVLAKVSS